MIFKRKVVTFPGHSWLAAYGTTPRPSQKLSSSTRGWLLFGCFCFGTGTVGALGDRLRSWPWYLDRNLQLIELLSPDGRGGTPCFHVVLASDVNEKVFPGSSDNRIVLLPSGDDIWRSTVDVSERIVVYTVPVKFGLSTWGSIWPPCLYVRWITLIACHTGGGLHRFVHLRDQAHDRRELWISLLFAPCSA